MSIRELTKEEQNVINDALPALQNTRVGQLIQQIVSTINTGGTTDEKVGADSTDTAPSHLNTKLKAGTNITLSVVTDGGVKKVQVDADNLRDFTIEGDAVIQDGLLYVRLKKALTVTFVDWSVFVAPTGSPLVMECEYAPDITAPVWTLVNEGTIIAGTYEDNNSGLTVTIPAGSVVRFNCSAIGSTLPGNTVMISMGS